MNHGMIFAWHGVDMRRRAGELGRTKRKKGIDQ
jgi:hypothetical protein